MKRGQVKQAIRMAVFAEAIILLFFCALSVGHTGCAHEECAVCCTLEQLRALGHALSLLLFGALVFLVSAYAVKSQPCRARHGVMTLTALKVKLSD